MARIVSSTVSSFLHVPGKGVPPGEPTQQEEILVKGDPKQWLAEKAHDHGYALQAVFTRKSTLGVSTCMTAQDTTRLRDQTVGRYKAAAQAAGLLEDEVNKIWSEYSTSGAQQCKNDVAKAKIEVERAASEEAELRLKEQEEEKKRKREASKARRLQTRAQGKKCGSTKGKGSTEPRAGQTIKA